VFEGNSQVYSVRKVWRQLAREWVALAQCTVARLMRSMSLQDVVRSKRMRATVSDRSASCLVDWVNRQFQAPRPNVHCAAVPYSPLKASGKANVTT
jgi:putative transposase